MATMIIINIFFIIFLIELIMPLCPDPEQVRTVIDKVFEELVEALKRESTTGERDRTHPDQSPLSPKSPEIEAPSAGEVPEVP